MTEKGQVHGPQGIIVSIVKRFLTSHLSIIFIILALCLGIASILATPREEEPQIVVPLADVFIQVPGASPAEIEKLVASPLERLLWQVDGVEYVYSMSDRDMAMVTVRFFVGQDREESLVKLHNTISMNIDQVPGIVKGWVIKPVEIDDVPIVNLTLYSQKYDDYQLRRVGEEMLARLAAVEDISKTTIVGGRGREIRVEVAPEKMAARHISILEVQQALSGADVSITAGSYSRLNQQFLVASSSFLSSRQEVEGLVVGVENGRPVYLRDVATVIDGPEEAKHYSRIGFSDYATNFRQNVEPGESYQAVTLALAKKKGTNAVKVAKEVLARLDILKKDILPDGIMVEVTRNYGDTAQQKVNDLLSSLGFAIISVVILLALTLGWREALVVALAVPISFSLALFVNYVSGYTINRVTLFALILSLGLVVDDPITNVDNIQRHILKGRLRPLKATLFAVSEVLPPVIMSTIAIIICFTPLFFITGMMGPYMAPMAANVPLTVIFSTLCAVTIVPWFSHLLLKNKKPKISAASGVLEKKKKLWAIASLYRRMVLPFLASRKKRYALFASIILLFVFSVSLALFRLVPLKLLPFDNKNEFQIVLDLPDGSTLESTDGVIEHFENYLRGVPEVTNFITYSGFSSPMDFNGLVKHYYLREDSNLADIRVNLTDRKIRDAQSHEVALRLRKDLEAIAQLHNVDLKIVEVPPGPPVLATIVAEINGPPDSSYEQLLAEAEVVKKLMRTEPFVVDVDVIKKDKHTKIELVLDKEKAALHGVSTEKLLQTLQVAVGGTNPANVHLQGERTPLQIKMILPRQERSGINDISQIPVKNGQGKMIPLAELMKIQEVETEPPIFHKNLQRVVYVIAETAGVAPAEAVLDLQSRLAEQGLRKGFFANWAGEGEWKITIRVFRDMGIAFAAALVGIYILLVVQANSFSLPILIMMAIPLTLLGIMPGFWLLNLVSAGKVGGFANPIFFTATSMIGMIALGGIVIRNSLVLIEFVQDAVKSGVPLQEAILQSGAVRMRPILLTALTTAIGAWPITFDPVFSGLAWALIFGLFASTAFTLLVIPVTYFAIYAE